MQQTIADTWHAMGDEPGETVWAFAVRDLVCHVREQQAEKRPLPSTASTLELGCVRLRGKGN